MDVSVEEVKAALKALAERDREFLRDIISSAFDLDALLSRALDRIAEGIAARPELAGKLVKAAAGDPQALRALAEAMAEDKEAATALATAVASHMAIPLNLATKEDIRAIEAKMVTKEDAQRFATKDDIRALEERMATKDDVKALEGRVAAVEEALQDIKASMVTKDDAKQFATKDDVKALEGRVAAVEETVGDLRKEVLKLEAFVREKLDKFGPGLERAVLELYRDTLRRFGVEPWRVQKISYRDEEGRYYLRGAILELDACISDSRLYFLEVKATAEREDVEWFAFRSQLFERVLADLGPGRFGLDTAKTQADGRIMVAIEATDEAVERARELGIELIYGRRRPSGG